MKKRFLTTLAAGLVACAAAPALAGTIQLTNRAAAGPVQVTFEEGDLAYGSAFGTINGATFPSPGLSADRDFSNPLAGIPYNGFSGFFGGGIVASNFVIPFLADPDLSAAEIHSDPFVIQLADTATSVGFDFVTQPGDEFHVELLSDGVTIAGSSIGFETFLNAQQNAPLVGFAGLQNLDGFNGLRVTLNSGQLFSMNDLRFGVAVVPLPPAAFMGLGLLAGIGIMRRLRRRSV